jgi:hypothetical protein
VLLALAVRLTSFASLAAQPLGLDREPYAVVKVIINGGIWPIAEWQVLSADCGMVAFADFWMIGKRRR